MGNRKISPDLKECALRLWNLGWDVEDICFAFCVSPRSLYRWRSIFDELGSVTKPERDEYDRDNFRGCIRNPDMFSGTGMEIVAVDESSKDARTLARHYGRAPLGQRAESSEEWVRANRYTLTAALTTEGYIATRIVLGSMDAYQFFDFIVEDVLPQMKPYPEVRSVLVLDNFRIHHTELLREVLNDNGVMMLFLPAYSPDLNPIEESFSTWKAYLRRHGQSIREAEDPVQVLLDSTACITPEMALGRFRHAGYIW